MPIMRKSRLRGRIRACGITRCRGMGVRRYDNSLWARDAVAGREGSRKLADWLMGVGCTGGFGLLGHFDLWPLALLSLFGE